MVSLLPLSLLFFPWEPHGPLVPGNLMDAFPLLWPCPNWSKSPPGHSGALSMSSGSQVSYVTNTCSAIVSKAQPSCQRAGLGLEVASHHDHTLDWPLPYSTLTSRPTLTSRQKLSRTLIQWSGAIFLYEPNSTIRNQHKCTKPWTLSLVSG